MAAEAAAAAVRDDVRRVVLPGERERLRRRPGDLERERERERERVWKPARFCKDTENQEETQRSEVRGQRTAGVAVLLLNVSMTTLCNMLRFQDFTK